MLHYEGSGWFFYFLRLGFYCSQVSNLWLPIEFINDLADIWRETTAIGRQYGTRIPMKDLRKISGFRRILLISFWVESEMTLNARQWKYEDPISPEWQTSPLSRRCHYTRAKIVGLGISTVREIVTQVCELIVDCIWQKCVIKHMPSIEQDLKIRWRKWMTGGSFLSVGLQLMVATFWLNAHQEEPPRVKNTIILKTVIQWCWWPW